MSALWFVGPAPCNFVNPAEPILLLRSISCTSRTCQRDKSASLSRSCLPGLGAGERGPRYVCGARWWLASLEDRGNRNRWWTTS